MLPQKHSIFYYACADLDPAIHSHLQKSRLNQAEVLLSLLIHVVILVRVKVYKKKVEVKKTPTGPRTLQVRNFLVSKLEKESLSDFVTNFCLVFWACIYSLLQIKVNSYSLSEVNTFPNYLYMYAYQLCGASITGFAVASVYYVRHKPMKRKLLEELKASLS